jgi:uncharacterized protein (DUF2267 family)
MTALTHTVFQQLYEEYSPLVWGIACRYSTDEKQAMELTTAIFRTLLQSNLPTSPPDAWRQTVIKTTYKTVMMATGRKSLHQSRVLQPE